MGDARPLYCPAEPVVLLAELEAKRRELAVANRQIARLLHERKRSRRTISRLKAMATTDVLTDLANRRRFDEVLAANFAFSLVSDSPLSVIMLDVDQFKSYNDTFGHSAGDLVLCLVAQHLVKSARPDDVVARYGGDEFAILLRAADAVVAINCAERYRDAIASFRWPNRPVTASLGVATRTPSIANPASLVEAADRALYDSKRGGRTWVVHAGASGVRETMSQMTEPTPATTRAPRAGDRGNPSGRESGQWPKLGKGPQPY